MAGRSVFAGRTGETRGCIANHSAAHRADDTSGAPRVTPSKRVRFRHARLAHGRQLPKLPPENGHSANNSEVHVQGLILHPYQTVASGGFWESEIGHTGALPDSTLEFRHHLVRDL